MFIQGMMMFDLNTLSLIYMLLRIFIEFINDQ